MKYKVTQEVKERVMFLKEQGNKPKKISALIESEFNVKLPAKKISNIIVWYPKAKKTDVTKPVTTGTSFPGSPDNSPRLSGSSPPRRKGKSKGPGKERNRKVSVEKRAYYKKGITSAVVKDGNDMSVEQLLKSISEEINSREIFFKNKLKAIRLALIKSRVEVSKLK